MARAHSNSPSGTIPNPNEGRGRQAQRPQEIPAPGWRDILLRVKDRLARDRMSIISAGVAFYALLAVFPAIGALISVYGLMFDPHQVEEQISNFGQLLPADALELLLDQLRAIAATSGGALSATALAALLLTLWSVSKGIKALMAALNVAYGEPESRGFLRLNLTALLLTVAAIMGGVIAIAVVAALPAVVSFLGFGEPLKTVVVLASWPLLALAMVIGLSTIYRFGPNRRHPRWAWASWGAAIATALWLLGSVLFSYYATQFGDYNKTYGSVGAVVVLMMWLLMSAYVTLIGAEINAEMERQTFRDTTTGEPKPLGERGAHAADTVGPTPQSRG